MTARPLLHALPTPSASERIASIQSEIATVLADETHALFGDLMNALAHATALAECPATSPGLREIARKMVASLQGQIGDIGVQIGRA